MIKFIPDGEGKAKLVRNKRGGIRLRVHIDLSHPGPFCIHCYFKGDTEECMLECKDFELVTGTKKFWFEREN